MKRIKFPSIFQTFSILLLFLCFAVTVIFLRNHLNNDLNSDNSSELILGRLLADEGKILTKSWYYSSELSVLNTNVIYAFFFNIFHSWHRVRLFSTVLMYLLLLISYYWMCSVYNIKKYFALSAVMLVIPFSKDYYWFVLQGAYYLPYINYAVLVLTFSELFIKTSGFRRYFILILSFLFSGVLGLAGGRELIFLFIPLLTAALYMFSVRKNHPDGAHWFLFSCILFIGNIIGFLINSTILAENYFFQQWSLIDFTEFSVSQFEKVISSLLYTFGYETGQLSFYSLFHNFICMIWMILTITAVIYSFRNRRSLPLCFSRLSTIYTAMFFVFFVYYCFTNTKLHNRYLIPIMFLSFPCISSFFEYVHWNKNIKHTLYVMIVLLTVISGMSFYYEIRDYDPNADLRKVSERLTAMGYYNGYATYWNANILTELSYGKIEVWSVTSKSEALSEVTDINETYKWNQLVSHDISHPVGKVFLLFTRYEAFNNNWKDNLPDENIIISSASYIVYGFDDYKTLTEYLYKK